MKNILNDKTGNLIEDKSEQLKIHWTYYNKLRQIDSANSTKLKFRYDAFGNRIVKDIVNKSKEIYVRDVQGNVIVLYEIKNDSLMSKEYYIYGTNRIGYMEDKMYMGKKTSGKNIGGVIGMPSAMLTVSNPFIFSGTTSVVPMYSGKKRYELSDWLGNIRVVVNDRKTAVNTGSVTVSYMPQVVSVTDYYSFGSSIEERSYDPVKPKYRFGFNGHEKDDEVKGEGNCLSFGDYGYDTRVGNRWSIEPKFMKYPYWSSYLVFGRNPIKYADRDGHEIVDPNGNRAVEIREGKIMFTEYATEDIKTVVNAMMLTKVGTEQVIKMIYSKNKIGIIIDNQTDINYMNNNIMLGKTERTDDDQVNKILYNDEMPDVKITIYAKSIQKELSKVRNEKVNTWKFKKIEKEIEINNFSYTELLGAISTHESVHAVDKNSNREYLFRKDKSKLGDVEKLPEEKEYQYYLELRNKK